jgi:hypothetical protein
VNLGIVPAAEAVADAAAADLACGLDVPETVETVSSTEFVAGTLASGEDVPEFRGDTSAAVVVADADLPVTELVCSSGSTERAGSKATPKTQSEAPKIRKLKTKGTDGMCGRKLSRFLYEMNQNLLF